MVDLSHHSLGPLSCQVQRVSLYAALCVALLFRMFIGTGIWGFIVSEPARNKTLAWHTTHSLTLGCQHHLKDDTSYQYPINDYCSYQHLSHYSNASIVCLLTNKRVNSHYKKLPFPFAKYPGMCLCFCIHLRLSIHLRCLCLAF